MATLIHVRYLPPINAPILTRKARLQRRCRDPLVDSFLCLRACSWLARSMAVRGHLAVGCGSSIAIHRTSVGRTYSALLLRRIFVVSTSTPSLPSRDQSAQAFLVRKIKTRTGNGEGLEPRLANCIDMIIMRVL